MARAVAITNVCKERAIDSLIRDGRIKKIDLAKPRGRANHYLEVDDGVEDSIERGKYAV